MSKAKIGFLGGGNMARALVAGLITDGIDSRTIIVADRNENKLQNLSSTYGVQTSLSANEVATQADILILAIKPQGVQSLCRDICKTVQAKQPLILSVVAGILMADITQWLGNKLAIVRTMPNTPSMLQAGATALFANEVTSSAQKEIAEKIMRSVGVTAWVDKEIHIDAVIAIAGSAPAYFFRIMELMAEIGTEMGLDPKTAKLLVTQTLFGAGKMALENPDSLSQLREDVTSKGGTTQAALNALEAHNLKDVLHSAMEAARDRSVEISQEFGHNRKLSNS